MVSLAVPAELRRFHQRGSMHAYSHMARSNARCDRLGFGRLRVTLEELQRAVVAAECYAMLKSHGMTRASVCLRVFEEFYSMANGDKRRG